MGNASIGSLFSIFFARPKQTNATFVKPIVKGWVSAKKFSVVINLKLNIDFEMNLKINCILLVKSFGSRYSRSLLEVKATRPVSPFKSNQPCPIF
jgi:hypothetical protein